MAGEDEIDLARGKKVRRRPSAMDLAAHRSADHLDQGMMAGDNLQRPGRAVARVCIAAIACRRLMAPFDQLARGCTPGPC